VPKKCHVLFEWPLRGVQIPVPPFFHFDLPKVKIQKISSGFEGGINGLNQLVVLVLPAGRHRTGLNTKKYNREIIYVV
jgi:hypothetical protein